MPAEAADVVADAARGIDATFRVIYDIDGRRVVVTQRPPDRRIDVVGVDGSEDSTITVDGRSHACTRPPGDAWACEELGASPAVGPIDAAVIDAFVAELDGDFAVEARDVAGVEARCVVTSPTPGALCVAPSGALLLVERPAGSIRATSYTTEVPDDAFALPA